jgi:hypothetical protein
MWRAVQSRVGSALACGVLSLVLASLDATYEWYAPVSVEGERTPWYGEVGVRNGALVWGNHEPPGARSSLRLRTPQLVPLPFYVGAGPEGGGVFLAAWVPGMLLFAGLGWFRSRTRRSQPAPRGARP